MQRYAIENCNDPLMLSEEMALKRRFSCVTTPPEYDLQERLSHIGQASCIDWLKLHVSLMANELEATSNAMQQLLDALDEAHRVAFVQIESKGVAMGISEARDRLLNMLDDLKKDVNELKAVIAWAG